MARYFVTSSTQFDFGGGLGGQASTLHARISVDGTLKAIVGLGNGISGVESPPGTWTYYITDKELSFSSPPSPGVVSIDWYAQDAGNTEATSYPTNTAPALDTVADPTALGVSSTSPVDDSTGNSTRDPIVITFDDNLDEDNFEESRITLRLKGSMSLVPINAYINEDDTTQLIIKPSSNLAETQLYELVIANEAVYSTGGNRMGSDYTLRFTTGADDFDTIEEATDEGVVERGAPIILSSSSAVSSGSSVSLTGSDPADDSCNIETDEIDFTFDDTLNAGVSPTVTIEFENIFGLNQFYYVGTSLWGKETEPTMPTVSGESFSGSTYTVELSAIPPGNARVTVTVSGLETSGGDPVPDTTIQYVTKLFPYRVGVPEVRNKVRGYISSDVTTCLIAEMITNVGLNLYYKVGGNALLQQRCVILNEVAMQLMDDYFIDNGLATDESKTLGAFSVSRKPASGLMKDGPYARIKNQLEKCWDELHSYFNTIDHGIKSSNNPVERPDYRIRTWRESNRYYDPEDEGPNSIPGRRDKLPDDTEDWS